MTSTIIPVSDRVNDTAASGWLHRVARKLVLRQLAKITDGQLLVQEGDMQWVFGNLSLRLPAPVVVRIVNASAWLDFAFGGSAAAGEAYVKGYWECDALTNLTRLFVRNRGALEGFDANRRWLLYPLQQLGYWLRRNTRDGSRRNIQAHYDIGNDLFRLFLDEKLMYSSAYYPSETADLDEAAEARSRRPPPRDRHGLGRAGDPCGQVLWLQGHHHDHFT